jgi:hypothetical protein
MKQVGIIGGNVGANAAFFIAENRAASVTLVDGGRALCRKALDILKQDPFGATTRISGRDVRQFATAARSNRGRPGAPRTKPRRCGDNAILIDKICEDIMPSRGGHQRLRTGRHDHANGARNLWDMIECEFGVVAS